MYTWINGLLGLLSDWLFLKSSCRRHILFCFDLFVCLFVYILFIVAGTGGDSSKICFLNLFI